MSKRKKQQPRGMELKELTYAEKIGLPNFSSAYLSVTAVLNGEDFQVAYEKCRDIITERVQARASEARDNSSGPSRWGDPDAPPTERQLGLIRQLCEEVGESMENIDEIQTRHEASSIIDALFKKRNEAPAEV